VTPLRDLVDWLEEAGHERIVLIDNDSTWEPMRDYLHASPHQVLLEQNHGARAPWVMGIIPQERWVYTDCDVVPIEECPFDLVDRLDLALDRYPRYPKAGPGLYLDDVPADLPSLEWERELADPRRELEPGVIGSLIDTTFALYRVQAPDYSAFHYAAIRLGFPYQARHTSWYIDEFDDETRHYLSRADRGVGGSSWAQQVYS